MKYNYTDTFRSALELASEQARELGVSEVNPNLLLWGILKEGTSAAIKFFNDRGLSHLELMRRLEEMLERGSGTASEPILYNVEAHETIARAAEISTLLGDKAISPLHLLLSIYFSEETTILSSYLVAHDIVPQRDSLLSRVEGGLSGHQQGLTEHGGMPSDGELQMSSAKSLLGRAHITAVRLDENFKPVSAFAKGPDGETSIDGEAMLRMLKGLADHLESVDAEQGGNANSRFPFADFGVDLVERLQREEKEPDTCVGRENQLAHLQQLLLRYKKCSPIIIGEPKVGKTEVVRQLARMIARGDELPEGFPYRHILQLSMARLFAGSQFQGGVESSVRSLVEALRSHPEVLLFIDDIHLMKSGGRGSSVDAAELIFSALELHGLRLIGTATSSGFSQSIDDSDLMSRYCYPILVEPLTKEQTHQVLLAKSCLYGDFFGIDLQPLLERILMLSERYMPALPYPYKAIELMDATGAEVRTRIKRADLNRGQMEFGYTEDDVDQALARLTGLPLERITTESELKSLIRLPHFLKERVIGQDKAVEAIARTVQRSRLGLRDSRRPIASMLFLGPTGVGKTYLAKALAREVFGSEDAMVRIDMSEFSERFAVSRLIGSPPGYVGFGEGGELTQPIRTKPYSLVLLDEIEKAHPDTYNILLQVFEDGRLTDTEGNVVDFRNTIVIMTSNVGSRQAQDFARGVGFAELSDEATRSEGIIRKALQRTFSPEFLNRLDEVIAFEPLSDEALVRILELELAQLKDRVTQQGYNVKVSPEACRVLALRDNDRTMGARPIRRTLQHTVEDKLLSYILEGKLNEGETLSIALGRDKMLRYSVTRPRRQVKNHR